MRVRSAFPIFASALVFGCTAIPAYSPESRVQVAELVEQVKCEIKQTVSKFKGPPLSLDSAAIGFSLTLRIETEIGPSVGADWVIPYHLTDTFTFGGSAGWTDTAAREGSFKLMFAPNELQAYSCLNNRPGSQSAKYFQVFGIEEWVERVDHATKVGNASRPTGLDYTLKFGVVANASGKPGFKIVNLTGTAGLSGKRTDTNTLVVTFIRAPQGLKTLNFDLQRQLDLQLDTLRLRDALRP